MATRGVTPERLTRVLVGACAAVLMACQGPFQAAPTVTAGRPAALPTATAGRALAVAVAVGSPTPTPALVGDYPTLVQQRVERVQQGLRRLEQQLAVLQKAPMRMAADDWRTQLQAILDDLAASSADLRSLGSRVVPSQGQAALSSEVLKLLDNLDFVVSEYRMALDYDPDATHLIRAGRAEKTTADQVETLLSDVRRPIGPAPTPSFAR